jgi:predicted Zn-dependent protease
MIDKKALLCKNHSVFMPTAQLTFYCSGFFIMKKKYTERIVFLLTAVIFIAGCAGGTGRDSFTIAGHEANRQDYVRIEDIANRLIPYMDPSHQKKYRVMIAEEPSINAFASPDYEIIVNRGTLDSFGDKEIWCILAHETAHIKYSHLKKQNVLSDVMSLGFLAAGQFVPGVGWLNVVANPVVTNAYSREQETQADLAAVEAIQHCGFKKEDYIDFLKKLSEISLREGYKDSFGIFSSHPTFKARIEAVRNPSSFEEGGETQD